MFKAGKELKRTKKSEKEEENNKNNSLIDQQQLYNNEELRLYQETYMNYLQILWNGIPFIEDPDILKALSFYSQF